MARNLLNISGSSASGDFWPTSDGKRLLVSIEPEHSLHEFKSINDAVNALFVAGHKELAREIHAKAKAA